jgi:HSP20 family molecular chaperone IbpA
MAETKGKELQAKQKTEVAAPAEQTRPGAVFVPAVDIFESEKEITLLADLPGVKSEDLKIDLQDNILTLSGDVAPFEAPMKRYFY